MEENEKKENALAFLRAHHGGVIATVSPENAPHASLVYYVCDEKFNIYFSTLAETQKFSDILRNPHVAFTVAAEDVPQTIQIRGEAGEYHFTDADEIIANLVAVHASNKRFSAPITKFEAGKDVIVRITPSWVRFGDFAFSTDGAGNIFTKIV